MKFKQILSCLLTFAILLGALTNVRAQDIDQTESAAAHENVILQWNRVLQQTISAGAHPSTIRIQRSYSMMHAAMYDAVNSIEGSHTPYLTDANPGNSPFFAGLYRNRRISQEAAAAIAAHGVLVGLFPSRQAIYDAELAESLNGIPNIEKQLAIPIGQLVAQRMLQARANDGWTVMPPPYVLDLTPGNWQPTPPANAPATFTHFRGVTPFAMTNNTQFLPVPPPDLTSAEYANEVNEVKSLGATVSAARTADQTQTAQVWASGSTSEVLLNNLFRNIAVSRNLSTAETARLFALIYIATHDALQTTNTTQYTYGRWRPITAIRRADEDGNPDTTADPAWTSLINAPATPTYSSNASSLTSAPAAMLALFFGRDDIGFQINFGGSSNITRNYKSFSAMTNEAALSRIFAGIHFRSDINAGQIAGRNVANYVFLNFMRPREFVR
jgi:hypothetical protein